MQRFGRLGPLTCAAIVGVVFGVMIRLGDAGPGVVAWLVNVAGPWFVVAFLAGATATRSREAAARAVTLLVAAVVAKYAFQLGQHAITTPEAAARVGAWSAAALATGAVFGPAGAALRRDGAAWLVVLAGALALEALAFLTGLVDGEGAWLRYQHQPAADAVLLTELAVAALALGWALRSLLAKQSDSTGS
jgi:hypothetical protein